MSKTEAILFLIEPLYLFQFGEKHHFQSTTQRVLLCPSL